MLQSSSVKPGCSLVVAWLITLCLEESLGRKPKALRVDEAMHENRE